MSFVRTVLGDIDPAKLGVCYAHEHVIIDSDFVSAKDPDFRLDSVEKAAEELSQFYAAGGRAMVDTMPCDAGRNVLKMAEVSRRSGVHLLVPTGLHLAQYYPSDHWGECEPAQTLAERFIQDITIGIDAHDYHGDAVERTAHRAGLVKVATGRDGPNLREAKIFEAAGMAHRATGVPILTHTEAGRGGLEQIECLQSHGVDLSHLVLSHTDRNPDPEYHRALLSTDVSLEYDSGFRWKTEKNPTLDLLTELLPEYPGQLMLGMDAARRRYWKAYGGSPGLCFLLREFREQLLERGVDAAQWNRLLVENPARVFAFRSTSDHSVDAPRNCSEVDDTHPALGRDNTE